METSALEEKKLVLEAGIRQMLIPKDPQDEKNAIIEIRAGTGRMTKPAFSREIFFACI
ncbi:MAG: PCRF domain-containing protein [Puia sp.]